MERIEPNAESCSRKRRWFQFSLRTLLLGATIAAVIASLFSTLAWWRVRYPSEKGCWGNTAREYEGSFPCFMVMAYAINGQEPTIACFVRIQDANGLEDPMPWLRYEDGTRKIIIDGQLIQHRSGMLQLFVDEGSGQPVRIVLDRADAQKYFGRHNTEFTTFQGFVRFREDVLRKKYLPEVGEPTTQDRAAPR